jgi:hypothetical protein
VTSAAGNRYGAVRVGHVVSFGRIYGWDTSTSSIILMEPGGLLRTNVVEQVHHFLRPPERFVSCALEDSELANRPVDFHEEFAVLAKEARLHPHDGRSMHRKNHPTPF